MDDKLLLPCPFCGGEADIEEISGNPFTDEPYTWAVGCKDCNIGWYKETKEDAIAAWNRRVQPVSGNPITDNKPITNADRIRSMTDEELAQFLGDEPPYFATYKQYIDWLRKPIESEIEHDA